MTTITILNVMLLIFLSMTVIAKTVSAIKSKRTEKISRKEIYDTFQKMKIGSEEEVFDEMTRFISSIDLKDSSRVVHSDTYLENVIMMIPFKDLTETMENPKFSSFILSGIHFKYPVNLSQQKEENDLTEKFATVSFSKVEGKMIAQPLILTVRQLLPYMDRLNTAFKKFLVRLAEEASNPNSEYYAKQ